MAQTDKASKEYAELIVAYLHRNFGAKGIEIHRETGLGTSIIGKNRRLDLLVIDSSSSRALGIECKYQDKGGTTDEKIPYALDDIAAMRIPGCLVYAGRGWSTGVLHMLEASADAAYCLPRPRELKRITSRNPGRTYSTWQLDHVLAMTFGWWELVRPGATKQLALDLTSATLDPETAWPDLMRALSGQTEVRERRPPKRVPKRIEATTSDGSTSLDPKKAGGT
jgi:hypothetical protein